MRDTELIFDQFLDAATCPDRIFVTEICGTFFEEAFEFSELFGMKFRRSTGSRLGSQCLDTMFFDDGSPESNGGKSATEDIGDLLIIVSLFDELTAFDPAIL